MIVEEEVCVPRRERENPEFESSSDEEGEDGVRRPKKTSKQLAEEEEARRKKEAAEAAKKRPAPASKDAEDEGIRASAEELAQAEAKKAQMGGKAVDAAPSGDARGQNEKMAAKEEEEEEVKEEEVEEEVPPVIEEDEEDPEAPPTNMPPSMGVSMATSTFVPPPPETFEPEFDTSKLASELTPGRLSIRCIAGINVRRKDEVNKVPKQDPFLKFKLGAAERHPWKSTEVQRKTDDNPDFQNEIVFFDVLEPRDFMFNGDLQLTIECWNKGTFKEEPMGAISVSVVRFMKQPFMSYEEKLPLLYPGQKTSKSKVVVELVYEEARPGIFSFKLYEGQKPA